MVRNLEAMSSAWERALDAHNAGDRRTAVDQFNIVRNRQERLARSGVEPPETLRDCEALLEAGRAMLEASSSSTA